jgi:DNA-binding NtrC family response regulator
LGNLAAEGRFYPALLATLSSGAVMLPPLRQRREDIPALIDRFWREITASQRTVAVLHASAIVALSQAYWPGNMDHLHNVIANLALTIDSEITGEHVRRLLGETALPPPSAIAPEVTARFFEMPLREAREAFERIYFEQLLGKEQSNMSRVADRAGLERTHLYRKLKQLNIRFARRSDEAV